MTDPHPFHGFLLLVSVSAFIMSIISLSTTKTSEFRQTTSPHGNVIFVDKVFGDDIRGDPFKTINKGLAAAKSGIVVTVNPGIYNESFTIPKGVTLKGVSSNEVFVGLTGVLTNVDLVTMSEGSALEGLSLLLTSSSNVRLRGIAWPGATSTTANARNFRLHVKGVGDTYAIHSFGMGTMVREYHAVHSANIRVESTGKARGVFVDSGCTFNVHSLSIEAKGANSIGVETDSMSAAVIIRSAFITGQTADISQTMGSLTIATTDLMTANANGHGFSVLTTPVFMLFGDTNTLPSSGEHYFYPGGEPVSNTELSIRIPSKVVMRSLSVAVRQAGVNGRTDVFIVRKNMADTILNISLTSPTMSVTDETKSVGFQAGDLLSMKVVPGSGPAPRDVAITLGFF